MSDDNGSRDPGKAGERRRDKGVSRRSFIKGLSAGGVGATLAPHAVAAAGAGVVVAEGERTQTGAGEVVGPGEVTLRLNVNGDDLEVAAEPRATLLDILRQARGTDGEYLGYTGNKRVCDRATCGACSMIVDGKLVYGCTLLAIEAQGKEVVTVEGLGSADDMHPVQQAFVERDALMCGFCTPGMVVAVAALLQDVPDPSRDQIRRALDGNICRCGTYPRIFEAAESAAARLREG